MEQSNYAKIFKALSNEQRLKIFLMIYKQCCPSDTLKGASEFHILSDDHRRNALVKYAVTSGQGDFVSEMIRCQYSGRDMSVFIGSVVIKPESGIKSEFIGYIPSIVAESSEPEIIGIYFNLLFRRYLSQNAGKCMVDLVIVRNIIISIDAKVCFMLWI